MAKKKVTKKKTTAKKKVVKKKSPVKKKSTSKKNSQKKLDVNRSQKKANKLLIYSIIIFAISFPLYLFIDNPVYLYGIFGLIAIISGSWVILSVILELIFWLLKKANKK